MEKKELYELIRNELESKGFKVEELNYGTVLEFTKSNKFNNDAGTVIHLEPVFRSNATPKDVNVRLVVLEWSGYSGTPLMEVKITHTMGIRAINNRITKTLEFFESCPNIEEPAKEGETVETPSNEEPKEEKNIELLISEYVEDYMKEDIKKLLDYDQEDLIDEITKSLAPYQSYKHLDEIMNDGDLFGLIAENDGDICFIDTPHGYQAPAYQTFEELKEKYGDK